MSTDAQQPAAFEGVSFPAATGAHRAADYWRLPEGEPVELLNGNLIMSPAPASRHQLIVLELASSLRDAARANDGVTLIAPIDVVLDDQNIVQPDVVYLAKDRLDLLGDRIEGAPSLVVEVLSPGTASRDRNEKLDLYARHGVPEYWIIDPATRTAEFLANESGRYTVVTPVAGKYASAVTPGVEIDLVAFWAEVEKRLPKKP